MARAKPIVQLSLVVPAVALATMYAHWPALDARALSFDDHLYLVGNRLVKNPGWDSTRRFLFEVLNPSTIEGYYQPLSMISLMLDCALGGSPENLGVFHRTSLLLHVANTVLMVVLLYSLFGSVVPAAMAGLLFGVHPLTVEPIPWVGERKTLLATFFSFLSLFAYVKFARARMAATCEKNVSVAMEGDVRRMHFAWYLLSTASFLAALLSKPTSTLLPLAMLLMDWWPLGRWSRRAVFEKLPLFALSFASAVTTYFSQAASYVRTPGEAGPARIALTLFHNIAFYGWRMVRPVALSSHYPFPDPFDLSNPMVRAGVLGTTALIAVLLFALCWTPAPLAGWLIFFVLAFPTMGAVGFTSVIASDKYSYLPSVGLLMVLAYFLSVAWRRGSAILRLGSMAACLLLAGLETRLTRAYLAVWESDQSLYGHMLALAPRSALLHFGLGYSHAWHGRTAEAMREYERAIECDSRDVPARNNLALLLLDQGRHDEAIEHFGALLAIKPDAPDVLSNLALALTAQGKPDEAILECRRALEIRPGFAPALNNLGQALCAKNRLDEAMQSFLSAVRFDPDFIEARSNLAATLWGAGRLNEAADHYREILRRRPRHGAALYQLGRLLAAQGKLQEAAGQLEEAVKVDPDNADAKNALRSVHARLGNLPTSSQPPP
jgi:tetratricopeptide (TPR) repeat protein